MDNRRDQENLTPAECLARAEKACRDGISRVSEDRLDDAEACFQSALSVCPGHAGAGAGLASINADLEAKTAAIALHQGGALAEAGNAYRALLERRPRYPEVVNNLGVLALQLGDVVLAERLFRQAADSKPEMAAVHANLGAALRQQGNPEAAVAACRRAIALDPKFTDAHFNLGHALVALQRIAEAVVVYQQTLALDPGHAGARASMIHQRRHLCDWREYRQDEAALRVLAERGTGHVTPFHTLVAADDPALQSACAQHVSRRAALGVRRLPARTPVRSERMRIAYLSSDFRRHPIAWLCSEVFERHDRERFEIVAYSHGVDDGSEERRRLQQAFDRFVDIQGLGDHDAAARIRADDIDILVDLNGHTLGKRIGILARRPAPVQVSWLGYPGAMGADYTDYVIGDPFVTPFEAQRWFTERIVQLPECFQPGTLTRTMAERMPTRAECGLPEQGFVFCCFNNTYKLSPELFEVWMRLLSMVPGSVLWLLEASAPARANLAREAQGRGIDPRRLVFAPRVPMPEYLARYRLADLFLDTLPYNAGATANDALWSGLPLLSCAGRSFAARMAGSLLHTAGLPELVTSTPADYETVALRLAREPETLAALRDRLTEARAGALFDSTRFTRHLEKAIGQMWELRLSGRSPESLVVRPL